MSNAELLFPGADVYPRSAEDLASKLPLICGAARELMRPLLEYALDNQHSYAQVHNLGGEHATEAHKIREQLAKRDEKGFMTFEELRLPVYGMVLFAEAISEGHPNDYEIKIQLLQPAEDNTAVGALGPAAIKSKVNYLGMEDNGTISFMTGSKGAVTGGTLSLYWITARPALERFTEHGDPPVAAPDLNARQMAIEKEHGVYGLAYDGLISHLQLIRNIIDGHAIIQEP